MTQSPVDPERGRAIDDLFDRALDQPTELRAAWLEAQCPDPILRAEVETLLAAHSSDDGLLDRNALELARPFIGVPPLERVGPYRVLREIGRGGMGVVYLAERDDGQYRRRVAIKLLRIGPTPEELHRRFLAERQFLASLNHPNIAQLLDGGVTETHLPYLVMEYVDGVPITTYCDRQRLPIEERLRLFHDVCAAVHHAHQNLIIHRDIKPSNILVTEDRRVKLLDFGIAKLMNPTLGSSDQPLTRTEWRVMTPEYASPEQVRGDTLTTASDVYALGVLLYELLCGRRPHRITSGSPHELTEVIVQRDPLLPSIAVNRPESAGSAPRTSSDAAPEEVAADRSLSVERLQRRLHGDLDAIVMMALRKESTRRYRSADVLWEDVQRHLDGLPVLAHHPTRWYRAQKFAARHRIEVAATALVIVSLVTGVTVAVRQAAVARRERDRAEQALGQSNEVTEFLVRLFRTPAAQGAAREQVTARAMLATGSARVEELKARPIVQAQMLDALGQVNEQVARFDDAEAMLRRALAIRRSQVGDNDLDVATTLLHLSSVIRQRGRTDDALKAAREAVAIRRRVLGAGHPDVASALIDVASLTSDPAAAESLYREVVAIQKAAFGPGDSAVATADHWLATSLARRGATAEAESLFREVVHIRERALGPNHPSVALALIYLGNHLRSYSTPPTVEVESVYDRALRILRSSQSLPQLNTLLNSLATFYGNRGDYVRGEVFAREALDVRRRISGVEHPLTTENMAIVARLLAGQKRYPEAEAMLRDALAVIERTLGPQHPRIAQLLVPLAAVHASMGRDGVAESELRRALAIDEAADRGTAVAAVAAVLGEVVARRGNAVESNALFERAANVLRPLPAQGGPDMRAAYVALAAHYDAVNRPADAELFRGLARGRLTGPR